MTTPPIQGDLVVDTSLWVAWLIQEQGTWRAVDRLLHEPGLTLLLPSPGLVEVIEITRRRGNVSTGEQIRQALLAQGALIVEPSQAALLRAAELLELSKQHQGTPRRQGAAPLTLSLADSMIIATAEDRQCPAITRDRYWGELYGKGLLNTPVLSI